MKSRRRPIIEVIIAEKGLCDFLHGHEEKKLFQTSTEIIYQCHVPLAAYVILSGQVEISKGKRVIETLRGPNIIIGARELLFNIEYPYSVSIKALSKTFILCRSSLKEVIEAGYLKEIQINRTERAAIS